MSRPLSMLSAQHEICDREGVLLSVYVCCICIISMPYMYALYVSVSFMCMLYMHYTFAFYVCLICMPYMYALYVCLICMPYMYAFYVCLICICLLHACRICIESEAWVLHAHIPIVCSVSAWNILFTGIYYLHAHMHAGYALNARDGYALYVCLICI